MLGKAVRGQIKKVAMLILAICMPLLLSGCGIDVPLDAIDNLYNSLNNRVAANQNIATELYRAGLMTEANYNTIQERINKTYKDLVAKLNSTDDNEVMDGFKILMPAVVDWRLVPNRGLDCSEGHTGSDCCEEQANSSFILNCIYSQQAGELSKLARLDNSNATISPIELVDPNSADQIMETMNYPIYVLNEGVSLDDVKAFLDQYSTANSFTDEFFQKSDNYFHELKDKDGNTVTLLDPTKEENQLIAISKSEKEAFADIVNDDDKVVSPAKLDNRWDLAHNYSRSNVPGIDMVITQHQSFDVMVVRFREFNTAAYEKIRNTLGLGEQKYMVTATENGGRVYLLQYPVGYISGFELSADGQSFTSTIAKSNLEINIKTEKIYKVTGDSVNVTDVDALKARETEVDLNNAYISLSGGSPDTSSFEIYGETGVGDVDSGAWNLTFGGQDQVASIPRIVLRDYLEASYTPGVTVGSGGTTDKFAVYGRKIRILKFEAPINTIMAQLCEADGTVNPQSTSFYVSDFADYEALAGTVTDPHPPYVKYIPSSTAEGVSTEDDETNLIDSLDSSTDYSTSKIETLQFIARDSIKCTLEFPGQVIGRGDYNLSDSKPMFYALIVRKNYQESGLINWIVSEADTNSTSWWNAWLRDHQFTYQIGSDELLAYLKDNYSFELGQAGYVLLNLDTLSKLQEELDVEAELEQTHAMRTFFKVLGYSLIGYAFVLMMCWVADTSVDLGLNLTQKVTFGRLVAVAGDEELKGTAENNHVSYIGFQAMVFSCLKIIFIGLLLIFVDIVSMVAFLSRTLGQIAVSIGDLIGG